MHGWHFPAYGVHGFQPIVNAERGLQPNVNTIPAQWRSIFGARSNGDDDAVPTPIIIKTAMRIATNNLAASGDESLRGARLRANCDQAGIQATEEGDRPIATGASNTDAPIQSMPGPDSKRTDAAVSNPAINQGVCLACSEHFV